METLQPSTAFAVDDSDSSEAAPTQDEDWFGELSETPAAVSTAPGCATGSTPQRKRRRIIESSESDREDSCQRVSIEPHWCVLHPVSQEAALRAQRRFVSFVDGPDGGREILALPIVAAKSMLPHQRSTVQFVWKAMMCGGGSTAGPSVKGSGCHPTAGCVVAQEMGCGKTLSAIMVVLLYHLLRLQKAVRGDPGSSDGVLGHTLILAPKSVLTTWMAEWERWMVLFGLSGALKATKPVGSVGGSKRSVSGLHVPQALSVKTARSQELKEWAERGGCLLLSCHFFYRLLNKNIPISKGTLTGFVRSRVRLVVVDEAHSVLGADTMTRAQVLTLETPGRLALTGTPVQNSLTDLFKLIESVRPGFYAQRYYESVLRAPIEAGRFSAVSSYASRLMAERVLLLNAQIGSFIRRDKRMDLGLHLKKLQDTVLAVPLNTCTLNLYKAVCEWATTRLKGAVGMGTWMQVFHCLSRLVLSPATFKEHMEDKFSEQEAAAAAPAGDADDEEDPEEDGCDDDGPEMKVIASHASLLAELRDLFKEATPEDLLGTKIRVMLEIVRQSVAAGRRVLVFAQWRHAVDACAAALSEQLPEVQYDVICGMKTTAQRDAATEKLKRGGISVLLMTTGTGSQGLNLQDASVVVLMDITWNPQVQQQAIGRSHRWGQRSEVSVYRLLGRGTHEENVARSAIWKEWLFRSVIAQQSSEVIQSSSRQTIETMCDTGVLNMSANLQERTRAGALAENDPVLRKLLDSDLVVTAMCANIFYTPLSEEQQIKDEDKPGVLAASPIREGLPYGLPADPTELVAEEEEEETALKTPTSPVPQPSPAGLPEAEEPSGFTEVGEEHNSRHVCAGALLAKDYATHMSLLRLAELRLSVALQEDIMAAELQETES